MKHLLTRLTGLVAALSLLAFSLGCPPEEDDPDDDGTDAQQYTVELAGENEAPPVATPATGEMDVDFDGETLTVEGNFENLVSELNEVDGSPAHIHQAEEGQNGPILYNVDVDPGDDNRSGTFEFEQELTDGEMSSLDNEVLYLNIHTDAYPGGELRGQLTEDAPEYDDPGMDRGLELTPEAHTHDPDSDGMGWAWNILRNDTFVSSGAVENLGSEVTNVTLEAAQAGETGDVVYEYEFEEAEDNDEFAVRFWMEEALTDDQVEVLENGNYYINVYTEDFEDDGELRGQIEDDAGFWEELFGGGGQDIDEAPAF